MFPTPGAVIRVTILSIMAVCQTFPFQLFAFLASLEP
jgi:hypothetical protein